MAIMGSREVQLDECWTKRIIFAGNPPKQYAQPVGWCRFSLVTAVGENNESWHMAYHGIKGGAIRRMLDKGELLFAVNECGGIASEEFQFILPQCDLLLNHRFFVHIIK
ncbi:Neuralized-like protein 4 [Armadillidium vulgare]|nr:Neuralized-like protein 4 [Armadillidium vulgare]